MESITELQEMALGRYLSAKRFQKPEWAVNDCNTFIVEWHDLWYQTDHFSMCNFDYDSALSAARWQKKFYPAPDFLDLIGYDQVLILPESGDVLLRDLGPFWCAWLVLGRQAYTVDHSVGLVTTPVNTIKDYTIWSKDA